MTLNEIMLRRKVRALERHIEELEEDKLILQHLLDVQGAVVNNELALFPVELPSYWDGVPLDTQTVPDLNQESQPSLTQKSTNFAEYDPGLSFDDMWFF